MKKRILSCFIIIIFFLFLYYDSNIENDIENKEIIEGKSDSLVFEESMKNDNIDLTSDIEELVSKINKPENLNYYNKYIKSYMYLNDKDILLRDEQYEVNNIDNYIKKEEVSLVNGNTILTYYDLNTNENKCSINNGESWNTINNNYFEESNQLFSNLDTYTLQETNDEYILTSSNLDFIKQNYFLLNIETLDDPTKELKNCYLSIFIDKETFCIKNYNIDINYTILKDNKKQNIEIVASCNYSNIIN